MIFRRGGKLPPSFFVSPTLDVSYIFIIGGPCLFEKYRSPLSTMPESQTPFFTEWLKGYFLSNFMSLKDETLSKILKKLKISASLPMYEILSELQKVLNSLDIVKMLNLLSLYALICSCSITKGPIWIISC